MDLVDKAFLRWQRVTQPRRFQQSVRYVMEDVMCVLSRDDLAAQKRRRRNRADKSARSTLTPYRN